MEDLLLFKHNPESKSAQLVEYIHNQLDLKAFPEELVLILKRAAEEVIQEHRASAQHH